MADNIKMGYIYKLISNSSCQKSITGTTYQ